MRQLVKKGSEEHIRWDEIRAVIGGSEKLCTFCTVETMYPNLDTMYFSTSDTMYLTKTVK